MFKQHVYFAALTVALAASLTGCGSYPLAPVADAPAAASAPLTIEASQTGSIVLRFNSGYQTASSVGDVNHISITISGGALNYPKNQIFTWPMSQDAVFDGLTAGAYKVRIDALDKFYAVIGTAEQEGVSVTTGQTTPVSLKLKLNGSASTGQGGISLGVSIEDGSTPTPAPSATPTPAPTPTPTPAPTTASSFSDGFESGFGNWQASWTKSSYSSATAASSNWNASTFAANGGTHAATPGGSDGKVTETGTYALTLANSFNLSGAAQPVLRFDLAKFTAQNYFKTGKFEVDASADGGATWTQVYSQAASQLDWNRVEVDLSSYKSANAKVRFRYTYDYYLGTDKMDAPCIDNVFLGTK
ncbi:MAG TPA: hypothetical protein V6D05_12870 [Stenomitos sp.]